MKAILVIDMPSDMVVEETKALAITLFNGIYTKDISIMCPLKPMPEKKTDEYDYDDITKAFAYGYNACIDEILGETE